MSFRNVEFTPSAAVASAGTMTLAYPQDTTAGDFAAYGHTMFSRGHQHLYSQDAGQISIAFGASDITVTYSGATSLPAGEANTFSLNMSGEEKAPVGLITPKRTVYIPAVRMDLGAPDTADADGILESQNLTAAGVFSTLNFNGVYGDPYANQYAILDVPRNVVAAWTTNAVLTITGEDEYGDVMVEASAGGSATFTGKKAFKKITGIATSVNITALTVGTGDVLGLPIYVGNVGQIEDELQDGVRLSAFSDGKVMVPFVFDQVDLLAPTAQNLVSPVAGYITGIRGIVQAAVTTGGAITVEANTVAVVGLSITVADAATAGTTHSDDVLKIATGLVAAGDDITVTPAAAFATAGRYQGYIIIEPIAGLNGTFVAGVQTTPTATTGDVRGTYDPAELANGARSFSLIARVPDPAYLGVDNYDG